MRAATIQEIKQVALDLMRERGASEVRFADIAKAMEMTPPALYRYFADREALLAALVVDAFDQLSARFEAARAEAPADDLPKRWLALAQTYRRWASEEPQQFALVFGEPPLAYTDPVDDSVTEATARALGQLSMVFHEALERGQLAAPVIRDVHPDLAECALKKTGATGDPIPPESFQAMLYAWASIHGFVVLEAYGHFCWVSEEARDALFASHARAVAQSAGLPT